MGELGDAVFPSQALSSAIKWLQLCQFQCDSHTRAVQACAHAVPAPAVSPPSSPQGPSPIPSLYANVSFPVGPSQHPLPSLHPHAIHPHRTAYMIGGPCLKMT